MKLIDKNVFGKWAKTRNIEFDDDYEEPRCLIYRNPSSTSRYWLKPQAQEVFPHFMETLLLGWGKWQTCRIWPRGGQWLKDRRHLPAYDRVFPVLCRKMGLPLGARGACHYRWNELPDVLAVMSIFGYFSSGVQEDLFVLPDHGKGFVWVGHDELVTVCFPRVKKIEPYVERMTSFGYFQPDTPQASTVKHHDLLSPHIEMQV